MAVYNVQAPDGKVLQIQGPEGATQEEVIAKAKELYTPGKAEEPSTLRKLEYGFASGRTDIGNLGDVLESYIPTGRFFNPTETYGEEFMQMEPEQRREFLVKRREAMIEKEYADVIAANEQDSLSAKIGNFGGSIFSPTTLIPVGQSYKAVAATSALLGAEYDVLDQFMKTGKVDPKQTATVAGLSGVGGTATIFAGRQAKNVYSKLKNKKKISKLPDIKAADAKADIINEAAVEAVDQGVPETAIPAFIQNKTGFNAEEILETFTLSNKTPLVPTINEVKLAKQLGDNGLDTTNRINSGLLHDLWQPVADRIEQVAPSIALRLRNVDRKFHENSMIRSKKVEPFMKSFKALSPEDQRLTKRYLLNGDFDDVTKILSKVPEGQQNFKEVIDVLDGMYSDLKEAGYSSLQELPNYFPRKVNDLDGLLKSLGTEKLSLYEKALADRAKQLTTAARKQKAKELKIKVNELPDSQKVTITVEQLSKVEKDKVLNNVARGGYSPSSLGLGATKKRTIEKLSDDQLDFYDDPIESLTNYIRSGTNNIEKRKFFGKSAIEEGEVLNIDQSVGRLIADEVAGKININDEDVLNELIKIRFTTGEQGSSDAIQKLRNFTYLTKLANPVSAVTQAQDLGTAVWVNGFGNTIKSLFGKDARRLTMQDLGLDQVLAEEFTNEQVMAKTLHKFFTASGFRTMDKYGKNVLINSSLRKAEKLVRTPKGVAKLKDNVGKSFGDEFTALVGDLQNGRITDNVKLFLWNELAKTQPISLSEMPLQYLKMPNGKVLYALKSFMLKQISNINRRTVGEFKKGNKKEAVKNAVSFALTVPVAGMGADTVKDLMLGRGFDLQDKDVSDRYFNNILKLYGASEYMVEKLKEGQVDRALGLGNYLVPALSTIDNIGRSVFDTIEEGEVDEEVYKELPIAGKLYYMWFGGGLEKENDRRIKEFIKGED